MKNRLFAITRALVVALVFLAPSLCAQTANTSVDHLTDAEALHSHLGDADRTFRLIDVRTPGEFASGHLLGAENIEYQIIGEELAEVDREDPIVLYCRSGSRAGVALQTLQSMGFENVVNFGGVIDWPYDLVQADDE